MKKHFFRSVSGLIFLFLLLLPQHLLAKRELVDRILVTIDDRIITQSALDEAFEPIRERINASGYSPDEKATIIQRYRSEVLKQLVDQTITDIAVERAGITVTAQEVEEAVTQARTNYNLSQEEFEEALSKEGLTLDLYRQQVRGQMLRARLVNYEIRSKIVITDDDLLKYYNENPERFATQRSYHLARIVLPFTENMTAKQREAQNRKMVQIIQRLQAGESFAAIADRENPPGLGGNGGELGWVDEQSLSPIIAGSLASLGPGSISNVLQSSQGLQLLKILEIAPQGQKPFEEVTEEVSEELYKVEANRRLEKWLEDWRDKVHIRVLE